MDDGGKASKKAKVADPVEAASLERIEELIAEPVVSDPRDAKVDLAADDFCDELRLTPGSVLYRPARLVVVRKEGTHYVVRNVDLANQEWRLEASLIRKQCESPDQYTEVKQVTMTQMASVIKEQAGDHVLKVVFTKLPDMEQAAARVREAAKKIEALDIPGKKKDKLYQRLVARSHKGDVRVMRGYIARGDNMVTQETETGMIKILDADLLSEGKNYVEATRILNLRTIISLNVRNVKYVVKK
jgi:hypothetical protein